MIESTKAVDTTPTTTSSDGVAECRCVGCNGTVTSKLLCPTCLKLGLPPSIFCSQECFKSNWTWHKAIHKAIQELLNKKHGGIIRGYESLKAGVKVDDRTTWKLDTDLRRFDGFKFTGDLRPWPQTFMKCVQSNVAKPDYYITGHSPEEQKLKESHKIIIRTTEEIQKIREASRIGREALDLAHSLIKPGVTGDEIDTAVHDFIVSSGGYPSPLNYNGFPKSCCISVNEIICHGIPDLRPLENGDIVNIDITVYKDGYHGDLNETFLCGNVDIESKALMKASYESMMYAIAECRPGIMYREIGNIISKVAEERGFSVVRAYCGHGIGTLFHTAPSVPHYRRNKAVGIMKPGHVFTIEPMINLGHWRDVTWPDDWTSATADGKRSAQFEHTVVITETGVELLTGRLLTSPSLGIDVRPEEDYLQGKHVSVIHD